MAALDQVAIALVCALEMSLSEEQVLGTTLRCIILSN